MRLKEKVALVTGGGTGMGRAIAVAFAREGAMVAVSGRRREPLEEVCGEIREAGGAGLAIAGDVSNPADAERMVAETVRRFGRLDILVNCAGVLIGADLAHHTEKIWDDTLDINLKGSFLVTQQAVPEMCRQGRGKVIHIASIAGQVGFPNSIAYCASKAGVVGMTRAMAMELAPLNINVNCIAPGDVATPLNEHLLSEPEYHRSRVESTPAGRIGRVRDVAPAAVYLASDESDYVQGAVLTIDGGFTIR